MSTEIDIPELRRIAEAMTIGPRHVVKDRTVAGCQVVSNCPCCGTIAQYVEEWDAKAIARFDRETLLALLDTVEVAQASEAQRCTAMSENKGMRFVQVREGLYTTSPGAEFEIERIEPGTRVEGLSGLNSVHMMLAGKPFWIVFKCEEGNRYPVAREGSLSTAKKFVKAHLPNLDKRAEAK